MMTHRIKLILIIISAVVLIALIVGLVFYFYHSKNSVCVVENCHGLDITCGPNAPQMCTEMYQLGDNCLQFAQCRVVGNKCQQIPNARFTQCKSCVQTCESKFPSDPEQAFRCESACIDKF